MTFNDRPPRSRRDELDRDLRRVLRPELERLYQQARARGSAMKWIYARELDRRDRNTWKICATFGEMMSRGGEA
jgi:hypothetical protein